MTAFQRFGIPKLRPIAGPIIGANERKVGIRIAPEHPSFDNRSFGGLDAHRLGVVDDVIVGHHEAIGRNSETGTMPGTTAQALDPADGRSDEIDGTRYRLRIGVQQPGIG